MDADLIQHTPQELETSGNVTNSNFIYVNLLTVPAMVYMATRKIFMKKKKIYPVSTVITVQTMQSVLNNTCIFSTHLT